MEMVDSHDAARWEMVCGWCSGRASWRSCRVLLGSLDLGGGVARVLVCPGIGEE